MVSENKNDDEAVSNKGKQICWEFKKCCRQPGGPKVADLGVCRATPNHALDGVHGGKSAGRA